MHKFALIPILFGLGIGTYFALPFEPSIWISLGVIEALIILAIIWRYYPYRLIILGYIGVFVLGFSNIELKTQYLKNIESIKTEETVYIKGEITSKDYNSRGNPRYVISDVTDFDDSAIFHKIRVSIAGSDFKIGQCIETVATLMPPFKAPFFGAYDFSKKAFYAGLQANGYATTHAYEVECGNKKLHIMSDIREKIIDNIYKSIPNSEAGIVAALVAGEKGRISKKIIEQYRDSGLAHVLSISGMHMSMIAGFMFLLVRSLLSLVPFIALKYNIKKISAVFALVAATFYLFISGAYVPAQRAFIMIFIVFLGVLFDRTAISMKNIAIAAMIILIISPEVLISPSFQMSFAAVFCMVAFYEKYSSLIYKKIKRYGFFVSFIIGLLIADFIASLATLPFAIFHFNKIALYTTFGNLLAGPIISFVIMPFILISLLFMPFGFYELPLKMVELGVFYMNKITFYVSCLDGATINVLSMPVWAFILIIFGMLFLCLWQSKLRLLGFVAIAIGFLSLLFVEKPQFVNMKNPSRFELMLIEQKYGKVKTQNKKPFGAVVYYNKVKKLNQNRPWHK